MAIQAFCCCRLHLHCITPVPPACITLICTAPACAVLPPPNLYCPTCAALPLQPRYSIFRMFDDVMLLGKGGRLVFLGPSRLALHYFESLGFALPPNENPAGERE